MLLACFGSERFTLFELRNALIQCKISLKNVPAVAKFPGQGLPQPGNFTHDKFVLIIWMGILL